MFKFNFDVDDDGGDVVDTNDSDKSSYVANGLDVGAGNGAQEPFTEIPLDYFLSALPSQISYSPLVIPLSARGSHLTLARRDLFDARFQLISDGAGDENGASDDGSDDTTTDSGDQSDGQAHPQEVNNSEYQVLDSEQKARALQFLDAPSDLVPGVYEGGLKTWECSLDLVDYLNEVCGEEVGRWVKGKRVLEVGCGTAVPSLYLLHAIFSSDQGEGDQLTETHIHLQDYNASVLELVTVPNLILAWYFSPASASYRASLQIATSASPPTSPATLTLTSALTAAFLASLSTHALRIHLFAGSWRTFPVRTPYDVVLTSETVYSPHGVRDLVCLLERSISRAATGAGGAIESGAGGASDSDVDAETEGRDEKAEERTLDGELGMLAVSDIDTACGVGLCLVAAKVVYFGVGGGVSEFVRVVESGECAEAGVGAGDGIWKVGRKGVVETVWEHKVGVGRRVMRVQWPTP